MLLLLHCDFAHVPDAAVENSGVHHSNGPEWLLTSLAVVESFTWASGGQDLYTHLGYRKQ